MDIKRRALSYPEAEEGLACPGTSLETPTVQVRKKAFLFLAADHLRLKLREALPEAEQLAAAHPERCEVGRHGWVKLFLSPTPDPALLERWLDDSYRALAPKKLVAQLP